MNNQPGGFTAVFAMMRDTFGVISMSPDAIRLLCAIAAEISIVIFLPVGVIPEANRHRRKGSGTHQFAFFARCQRTAFVVPDFHRHAQTCALQLTAIDRQQGVTQRKTGDDVGTAGDGTQRDIGADIAVHIIKAFMRQRRTGGEQGAHFMRLSLLMLLQM